jgi:hypothetical protein
MQLKNNRLLFSILFLVVTQGMLLQAVPFIGGYFVTGNTFNGRFAGNSSNQTFGSAQFTTVDNVSFYVDNRFNDFARFYFRTTAGIKLYTDIPNPNNGLLLSNLAFVPNIDLLYFEFKSRRKNRDIMIENKAWGETNFDIINVKFGRILVNHGSGMLFNMKGDGIDTYFSIKNFRMRFFAVTNSFDYLPIFNFIDGASTPIFTQWDRQRMVSLDKLDRSTYPGSSGGYYSIKEADTIDSLSVQNYNFYFSTDLTSDYSQSEQQRLNLLRKASAIAGRVFTGVQIDVLQVFFQNFTVGFLANVDLIPDDFILTYPTQTDLSKYTFGGKYTSFYLSLNANGKIWRGLYYNVEGVYQTGYNATYIKESPSLGRYDFAPIHSFALNATLAYYFYNKLSPTVKVNFYYAHGDSDVQFDDYKVVNNNYDVLNVSGHDNNFKAPTSPTIGYVFQPDLSNLIVIEVSGSVKPLNFLKKEIFSRFFVESAILFYMKPVLSGGSLLPENTATLPFQGTEVDVYTNWNIFSDLAVQLKMGLYFPGGIVSGSDIYSPYGKLGLTATISF